MRNLASEQEGTNWEGIKLMTLGCGGAARRRRKILGCICVLTHTFPLFLNDLGASCGAVSWLISLSKLYSAYNLSLKQQKKQKTLISRKNHQKSLISLSLRGTPPPRGWGVDKPLPEGVTLTGITFVSPFLSDITPMGQPGAKIGKCNDGR